MCVASTECVHNVIIYIPSQSTPLKLRKASFYYAVKIPAFRNYAQDRVGCVADEDNAALISMCVELYITSERKNSYRIKKDT